MRTLKGFGAALTVSSVFTVWLVVMLGASWLFAMIGSGIVGLSILAVVLTGTTERDIAADAAWLAAAPDLPPASDRRRLERGPAPAPAPRASRTGAGGRVKPGADR